MSTFQFLESAYRAPDESRETVCTVRTRETCGTNTSNTSDRFTTTPSPPRWCWIYSDVASVLALDPRFGHDPAGIDRCQEGRMVGFGLIRVLQSKARYCLVELFVLSEICADLQRVA